MNKSNHNSINFAVSMMLFTVFALFLTLVLLTGASSFRKVSEKAEERFTERTPLLYVTQKVRAADRSDSVRIAEIDNIPVLILTKPYGDDFGNSGEIYVYIYEHDGFLKEFYAFDFDDSLPRLEIGEALFPVKSMDFEWVTESLLKITINENSIYINLSSRGFAPPQTEVLL
jgi:hypothetical protein